MSILKEVESLGWTSDGCTIFLHFDDGVDRLDAGINDMRCCDNFYLSHNHHDHNACIKIVNAKNKIFGSEIKCFHSNANSPTLIDTYGYWIREQVLFITDTGKIPTFPKDFDFKKVKTLIIECNYNKLWVNHFKPYIPVYQLRSIRDNGHLSDIDCISFIIDFIPRDCLILLIHETTNETTIPNYDMFATLPNNVVRMSQPNRVLIRPDGRIVSWVKEYLIEKEKPKVCKLLKK
jgi:hypothetical protein